MPALALQIAQPCHESWAAMTPTEGGRHCATCQKTVIDFTWKTDAEILAYLASASSETCGRLRTDQQNRPLVSPSPARPAPRWRTWLASALALWSTRESLGASAHPAPSASSHHSPSKAPKLSQPARAAKRLHGTVRDAATHEPLVGVAIFLKDEHSRATTDSAGRFSLWLPAGRPTGRHRQLVLHRAGYLSRQLPLAPAPGGQLELVLRTDPAAVGVEVIGIEREREYRMSSGSVTTLSLEDKPPALPAARPRHGFFHWLTRPFRRS